MLPDGSTCRYLGRTGQALASWRLKEFCLYFSGRLSFAEVAKLLERLAGERLVCEQTLWNWAQQEAHELSEALRAEVAAARSLPKPTIAEEVDIYDACSEEVSVLTDAIQVEAQKPTRRRRGAGEPQLEKKKKKVKRINTDLMLLQGRDGSFRHLSPPFGGARGDGGFARSGRGAPTYRVGRSFRSAARRGDR